MGQERIVVLRGLLRAAFVRKYVLLGEHERAAVHAVVGVVDAVFEAQARPLRERPGVARAAAHVVARLVAVGARDVARGVVRGVALDVVGVAEGVLPREAELLVGAVGAPEAEREVVRLFARQAVAVDQRVRNVESLAVAQSEVAAAVDEADVVVGKLVVRAAQEFVARVVVLQAERRAHHHRMALRKPVVDARIETVVEVERLRTVLVGVEHQLVRCGEGLLVAPAGVAVVGAVEEVAGRDLAFLAPVVAVIDSDGLHGRDAVQRAHHEVLVRGPGTRLLGGSEDVLEREVLAADVVHQTDHRDPAVVVEDVDVASADVFVRDAVGPEHAAESAPPLVGQRHDVQRRDPFAGVHAREFRLVALRVVDVDALDHVGRDVAHGRHHVVAEKFASIDIDALHAAALRLDRPVGDLQSGHFRDQRAGVRPERHLVGRGAVGERVAADRRPERRNLDHHVVDGLGAGCEPQRIERHGGRSDPQVGAQRVVTQRSDGQTVFASRHTGEESPAVDVRGGVEGCGRGVRAASQFGDGTHHRIARRAVGDPETHGDGLCRGGRGAEQAEQQERQCLSRVHRIKEGFGCQR